MPKEVEDCVQSVLDENPEYSESRAYAICNAQKNRGNLSVGDDASHDELLHAMATELTDECDNGYVKSNGECVKVETVTDVAPESLKNSIYQLASLESEPIEREELEGDKVAYRNMKILQSGTWTDSASRETVWYSPRGLENMELTEDNAVNIMHDDDNDVSKAGKLENLRAEEGSLYADIVIDKSNSAGSYADENLQKTLETQGANGFGGPSVEIPPQGQEMEYNDEKGMRELVKGKIDGLGLVRNPASKPTSFARQSATRSVALSDSQNVMRLSEEGIDMSNMKAQILSEFTAKELAGPQEVEEEAQSIADELDVAIDEVLEVLDPLFDMEEEDEEEGEEMETDEEEDNPEDENPDDNPDDEEEEMDMETKVQSLEERLQNLEDMMEQAMAAEDVKEELEEFEQDLAAAETVQELSEAKEDLEKRLSELEDKPDYKTLSDSGENEEDETPAGSATLVRGYDPRSGTISR